MRETLKEYWSRNSARQDAHSLCQLLVSKAEYGDDLRNAATFLVGSCHDDDFGSMLRDKIFARVRVLSQTDQSVEISQEVFHEARSLGEALALLNG
jgi:hypothetical protein